MDSALTAMDSALTAMDSALTAMDSALTAVEFRAYVNFPLSAFWQVVKVGSSCDNKSEEFGKR
jgi:hypothetical protein